MEITSKDADSSLFAMDFWLQLEGLSSNEALARFENLTPSRLSSIFDYDGIEKDRSLSKLPAEFRRKIYRMYGEDFSGQHSHLNKRDSEGFKKFDEDILSKRYKHDMAILRNERDILESSFNAEVQSLREENRAKETMLNEARANYSKNHQDLVHLKEQVEQYAEKAKQLQLENTELKQKQLQSKIDTEVPAFVDKAKRDLAINEKHFRLLARTWNRRGTFAIGGAAVLSSIFVIYTAVLMFFSQSTLNWALYGTMLFKEMLVVSILAAFAKYAYAVGSAYTHESVKRTDRIHAIGFGKMYLEIYGSQVDQQDVKSIFENWNLNSDSSFTKIKEADFENKTYNKLADAIIALSEKETKKLPEPK